MHVKKQYSSMMSKSEFVLKRGMLEQFSDGSMTHTPMFLKIIFDAGTNSRVRTYKHIYLYNNNNNSNNNNNNNNNNDDDDDDDENYFMEVVRGVVICFRNMTKTEKSK